MTIIKTPITFNLLLEEDAPNILQIRHLAKKAGVDIDAFMTQAVNNHYDMIEARLARGPLPKGAVAANDNPEEELAGVFRCILETAQEAIDALADEE